MIKNGASDSETESNGYDESQNNSNDSKPTLPQEILVCNLNINTKVIHFFIHFYLLSTYLHFDCQI